MRTKEYLFKLHRDSHILTVYQYCENDEEAILEIDKLKEQYKGVNKIEVSVKYIEFRHILTV